MANAAQLDVGQVIGGDFRVVEPLGAGGMGSVYVAEQLSTGKKRALKVMHTGLAGDQSSASASCARPRRGRSSTAPMWWR